MNYLKKCVTLQFIKNLPTTKYFSGIVDISSSFENKITQEFVPFKPISTKIDRNLVPHKTIIDEKTITLLEKFSLVDCANKQGIEILEDAITFADQIHQVDTTNIEPFITVLEDRPLETREDKITEQNCKNILSNATVVEEEYLVAPPGNIPLESREHFYMKEN